MYNQKNNKKKIDKEFVLQLFFSIVGILVFLMILFPLMKKINKQRELNNEINELEQEKAYYVDRGSELTNIVEYLNSDQFIDEQARLNLNYKKDGEEVVVINGDNSESSVDKYKSSYVYDLDLSENKNEEISNASRWFNYFFGKKKNL